VRPQPEGARSDRGAASRYPTHGADIRCLTAGLDLRRHHGAISTRSQRWLRHAVLASNSLSRRAGSVLRFENRALVAWGLQYHPEFSLHDIGGRVRRYARSRLVFEGSLRPSRRAAAYTADPGSVSVASRPRAGRLAVRESTALCFDSPAQLELANWDHHQSCAYGVEDLTMHIAMSS